MLMEAAAKSGKMYNVFQQSRFAPYFRKIREIIESGVLGRIIEIDIQCNAFSRRYDWQTLQSFNAGSLFNTGPHPLDQALSLLDMYDGMPNVLCKMDCVNTYGDANDYCKLILTAPNKPLVCLDVSSCDAYPVLTYKVMAQYGGIKASLGSDGYYRADLGEGRQGSKIYADFTGITSLFNTPIATVGNIKGMIDKGAFDFSKDENDQYIVTVMAQNDNDPAKTDAALKELWGEDYEANYEIYKVEDVYAGKYHGKGEDYTEIIKSYLPKVIKDKHKEREGCVLVDAQLAEILQMLMEKFTFENVDQAWLKLCYYYDYLGPGRAG